MINLLKSEWIKFHTVRVNWVLGIIAVAFPLAITSLVCLLSSNVNDAADDFVGGITATMVLTSLLLGVVGSVELDERVQPRHDPPDVRRGTPTQSRVGSQGPRHTCRHDGPRGADRGGHFHRQRRHPQRS